MPARRPELPDLDKLTAETDFSVFLRAGVEPALCRAALRKLWSLDPALSELDGLVDYGEDFTKGQSSSATIRTAYRVAREVSLRGSEAAPSEAQSVAPETQGSSSNMQPDADELPADEGGHATAPDEDPQRA